MAKNPKDTSSTKCFSSIFQRLICGGSLPTHPCDQFKEANTTTYEANSNKLVGGANSSPGIVARLMGLESLPREEKSKFGSFSRSKSANSLDYLMQFDLTQQFHHRRVRTSLSFREIPNQEESKSEYLVFCINDEKQEMMKPKKKRQNVEKKQVSGKQNRIGNNKVKKQVIKFEDYPTKMCVESKKNKRKSKCVVSTKIQPLYYNSTPNDHLQQDATIPSEGKIQVNSDAMKSKVEKQKEISKEKDHYIKVVGEICRLTEEELNESHWITSIRNGENINFEDLCQQFGQQLLQLLIDQLVHELVIFAQ
ncbi:uncharacterized protein TRM31 [Solanum lycopersicum]|uniref:DUF3741 domain-containing protein n=2 Tax=Solanum subgen. Lycopersicon TaxID=49274 RepID=A0A3Q7HVE3_SOLLC|nr:uncharacterized protein LOC101249483 [Solanum lycopersicum]XP_015087528.1 uncharacterized protein LOC107030789 [Solanum pennellii]